MAKDNENGTKFGLTTASVNNRKTVFLVAAIILLGGVSSYLSMPKENFPELQIPEIYIGIANPGNSPKFMKNKITEPIEKEVKGIENIKEIRSTSLHGFSSIQVEFNFNIDITDALNKVKDAVDEARAKKEFPDNLPQEPNIFEMDVSEMPILNINLSGNYSIQQLDEYAEIYEEKIEDLPEISEVEIRGTQEQEMQIQVDRLKAESVDISFGDIEKAINQENLVMSGGEFRSGDVNRTLRIDGEFTNARQIGNIIVKEENNDPIYMKDIANVEFADADTTSFARQNGKTVVMLDVKKRGGENLLDASRKIDAILDEARTQKWIPNDVTVTKTSDQSDQTRNMVSNLENSIILGVILVTLVLLFFLGLRNALFVGVAIPLSMFMSFGILSLMDVSLNTIVLFALVLALGMLVDNGIVVVENVYRLMDKGMNRFDAAIYGVGEIAWPIIASTATTLAAFVPLALWPGIFGEFMKYLPITLIIVLGSSLFVALVINPVLTAVFMKVGNPKPNTKRNIIVSLGVVAVGVLLIFGDQLTFGNLMVLFGIFGLINLFILTPITTWFQNRFLPVLENGYEKFITFALSGRKPIIFLILTVVVLIGSIGLMVGFTPKVVFFPDNEPQYVNIFIKHPIGTHIKKTNETTLAVEKKLDEILKPYLSDTVDVDEDKQIIQSVIAQVGKGTSDPRQGPSMGDTPHKGRITVSFTEFQHRGDYKTSEILKEIRNGLKGEFPADVQVSAAKNQHGPPQEPPINIELKAEDNYSYKKLLLRAEDVKAYLENKNIRGVEQLKIDVESGKPELPIRIDRDKARRFNTSTAQIAQAIRTSLFGKDISTFKRGDETYDLTVRFQQDGRKDLDALLDQKLIFRNNKGKVLRIPIRSVIKELKPSSTYSAVKRKDLESLVTIYSDVTENANPNEVVARVENHMQGYENEVGLPKTITYDFTGQQEEQAKELAFLSRALLIAVFLILLIIVSQFNSYSTPTIILSAVFFSLIGVLLGLVIFQLNFVIIMTMIGIISLAGIVVNNAIVLIDYTNLIRKRKREELNLEETEQLPMEEVVNATILGGKTRLRPVLLTAITTILGLIPLAIGLNINFITLLSEYDPKIFFGGDNAMFFGPMATTIIFGLAFATFLTLVIVPVMYLLIYRFKVWTHKVMNTTMRSNI